jgi:hypothetical protein
MCARLCVVNDENILSLLQMSQEPKPPDELEVRVEGPVYLTREQIRALDTVQKGDNVFITGAAGTGECFVLCTC